MELADKNVCATFFCAFQAIDFRKILQGNQELVHLFKRMF